MRIILLPSYYFFFEDFLAFGFGEDFIGLDNLDNEDFILAALFFFITFFFAARSVKEMALITAFAVFDFFASLIAISNLLIIKELTIAFLAEPLKALFAVTVTGMRQV